jgi:hypothetical protein
VERIRLEPAGPAQNLVDIIGGAPQQVREVWSIGHQTSRLDVLNHAERMRAAIVNEAGARAIEHPKYVMRITGDSPEGKAELDNFIDPESRFPVIATTSELMTTGVDARTCKLRRPQGGRKARRSL